MPYYSCAKKKNGKEDEERTPLCFKITCVSTLVSSFHLKILFPLLHQIALINLPAALSRHTIPENIHFDSILYIKQQNGPVGRLQTLICILIFFFVFFFGMDNHVFIWIVHPFNDMGITICHWRDKVQIQFVLWRLYFSKYYSVKSFAIGIVYISFEIGWKMEHNRISLELNGFRPKSGEKRSKI